MNELVSVVLPIYKEPLEWIIQSIESMLNQTYDNLELILVIDNPDRQDVIDWIDKRNDSRMQMIVNPHNLGLVASLNRGVAASHGNYIARMDADDISLPDRIALQMTYMRDTGCDLVGCNTIRFNDVEGILGTTKCPSRPESMRKYIELGGGISHPTWLFRKEMYNEVDGYRSIALAEDYDFLIRALMAGLKLGCIQEVELKYRQNLEGVSQQNKGKQKYTAELIRKQYKSGKVQPVDSVRQKLVDDRNKVGRYTSYYRFTRQVRNSLILKDRQGCSKNRVHFRLSFIIMAIRDVTNTFHRRLFEVFG